MRMQMPARTNEQVIHGPVRPSVRPGGRDERGYKPRKIQTDISTTRCRSPWKLPPLIFLSHKSSAADHPGLAVSPVRRGHVHHRRAAALFVSSGKFSLKWLKQLSLSYTVYGVEQASISVHQARCGLLDAQLEMRWSGREVLQPTTTAGYAAEHDGSA